MDVARIYAVVGAKIDASRAASESPGAQIEGFGRKWESKAQQLGSDDEA